MPLNVDFAVILSGDSVVSSKASHDILVSFNVGDISESRLKSLSEATGETWSVDGKCVVSESFPEKICGEVVVTEQSLSGGKSEDIRRSNGFFIRVRGRVVNEEDELFGLPALSHENFVRFRGNIICDDLDKIITAPREGVRSSNLRDHFQKFLREIFNEARGRYDAEMDKRKEQEKRKREHERRYTNPRLVEVPVADVISLYGSEGGGEADATWFYVELEPGLDLQELAQNFYISPSAKYRFEYRNDGNSDRLAKFSPAKRTFYLNADHTLVKAHADEPRTQQLLEDLVAAEVMLEIYLREAGIEVHIIGELLERRDALLKSLAEDHFYSLDAISAFVKESKDDEHNLEVAAVAAVRALGFVATHVSGAGEPDGIATVHDYPAGQRKITLECKSSKYVPSLSQIDFAGLRSHATKHNAEGCLLLAPSYPNEFSDDGEAAHRAREQRISCWKIDQLGDVVSAAEARQITALDILKIVTADFEPTKVTESVSRLLAEPTWSRTAIYRAILDALRSVQEDFPDAKRDVGLIAGRMDVSGDLKGIPQSEIKDGLKEIAAASKGMLRLAGSTVIINGDIEEIERRLSTMTGQAGLPRRRGSFREDPAQ